MTASSTALLVGTRKGAWILSHDAAGGWTFDGPHFLGHNVHHLVLDPRDGRTLLAAAKTGHLGPTVFRSDDAGKTWNEAVRPPAFPKAPEGSKGRSVDHTFWLTPGHASQPGVWYAGTSPQGLFRSEDGGASWDPVSGFNDAADHVRWFGGEQDGTPDGPKLHSVIVDPRDAAHMYVGMSGGGVHESLDAGKMWRPMVDGMEVVDGLDPNAEPSAHDPHCVVQCPSAPDRLYQQNHCGIYRLDRPSSTWDRIGRSMPAGVGDIGFGIVAHPRNEDIAWVFPMDGTDVWPRTSPDGRPAVYMTSDAGASWQRQDNGMPAEQAWWTVMRQALAVDRCDDVSVYLGTTSGEIWQGRNEGRNWHCIARHLPEIYAVEAAEFRT